MSPRLAFVGVDGWQCEAGTPGTPWNPRSPLEICPGTTGDLADSMRPRTIYLQRKTWCVPGARTHTARRSAHQLQPEQ